MADSVSVEPSIAYLANGSILAQIAVLSALFALPVGDKVSVIARHTCILVVTLSALEPAGLASHVEQHFTLLARRALGWRLGAFLAGRFIAGLACALSEVISWSACCAGRGLTVAFGAGV